MTIKTDSPPPSPSSGHTTPAGPRQNTASVRDQQETFLKFMEKKAPQEKGTQQKPFEQTHKNTEQSAFSLFGKKSSHTPQRQDLPQAPLSKSPQNLQQAEVSKAPQDLQQASLSKAPQDLQQASVSKAPQNLQQASVSKAPQNLQQASVSKAPQDLQQASVSKAPQNLQQASVSKAPQDLQQASVSKAPQNLQQASVSKAPQDLQQVPVSKAPQDLQQASVSKAPQNLQQTPTSTASLEARQEQPSPLKASPLRASKAETLSATERAVADKVIPEKAALVGMEATAFAEKIAIADKNVPAPSRIAEIANKVAKQILVQDAAFSSQKQVTIKISDSLLPQTEIVVQKVGGTLQIDIQTLSDAAGKLLSSQLPSLQQQLHNRLQGDVAVSLNYTPEDQQTDQDGRSRQEYVAPEEESEH